jgi:hypothetical protein
VEYGAGNCISHPGGHLIYLCVGRKLQLLKEIV